MTPLEKLASYVAEFTGGCPHDDMDWEVPGGCEKECGEPGRCSIYDDYKAPKCWKDWAES